MKSEELLSDATHEHIQELLSRLAEAFIEHVKGLRAEKSLADPDDLAAQHLITLGQLNLPDNSPMARAATAAGFAERLGRPKKDDIRPLLELSLRVRQGQRLTRASIEVATASNPGESPEKLKNIASSLRRKHRRNSLYALWVEDVCSAGASLDDTEGLLRAMLRNDRSWRVDPSSSPKKYRVRARPKTKEKQKVRRGTKRRVN